MYVDNIGEDIAGTGGEGADNRTDGGREIDPNVVTGPCGEVWNGFKECDTCRHKVLHHVGSTITLVTFLSSKIR